MFILRVDAMTLNTYKKWYFVAVALLCLPAYKLYGVTLVYNMKIRRAFNTSVLVGTAPKTEALLTGLPIFYIRDRHIVIPELRQDIEEKLVALGAIFNLRVVTPKFWWAELTTGIENQKVTSTGTNPFRISGTGMDDIILSAGKNFFVSDEIQVALYGLAGFPVKQDVSIEETQTTLVGTRFYGLGVGMELSYAFLRSLKRSVVGILQERFVHFFDRSWYPIFPRDAKIQPGNITDIFVILQYQEMMNVFEVGYNPTFFMNQAAIFQTGTVRSPNFVRNSFYVNYMYLFRGLPLFKVPGALGLGLNIGRSHLLDTKIISGWFNITWLF